MNEYEHEYDIRRFIAEKIGRDAVYISSGDSERHFDAFTVVINYAGVLALLFLHSAAQEIWEKLKKGAEASGKSAADHAWERLTHKLLTIRADKSSSEEQVTLLKKVADDLNDVGSQLEASYVETFLATGKQSVQNRLIKDGVPDTKAARIADQVEAAVRSKLFHIRKSS